MSYSLKQYTGDGSTANFTFPFGYISPSNITVTVNGASVPFTFLNTNTVTTAAAPAPGTAVIIKRSTVKGSRLVDFQDNSVLTEAALDLSAQQLFYLLQELSDTGGGGAVGGGTTGLTIEAVQAAIDAAILNSGGGGGGGGTGGVLAVSNQVAAAGKTSYVVSYIPGTMLVAVEGFILPSADYVATTGAAVVFPNVVPAGKNIMFISLAPTPPAVAVTAATVSNTPGGTLAATTVQAALNELDTEKAPKDSPTFTGIPLLTASPSQGATGREIIDAGWVLAKGYGTGGTGGSTVASGITYTPTGSLAATNVQAALNEVDGDVTALASSVSSIGTANTGDETAATIKSKLGITTLSGANTGDATATSTGNQIASAVTKTTPVDTDSVGLSDSADAAIMKKLTWAQIKATLKTYFDPLYAALAVVQTWTAAQRGGITALAVSANTVAVNLALSNNFSLPLQATTGQTLSNPTNMVPGQGGHIYGTQNATPSTLAFGASWKRLGTTVVDVPTTASADFLISYYVVSATRIIYSLDKLGNT